MPTQHIADHMGVHICYGSRTAQPARVRAFIDLAIELLANEDDYTLRPRELAAAAAVMRRTGAPGRASARGESRTRQGAWAAEAVELERAKNEYSVVMPRSQ